MMSSAAWLKPGWAQDIFLHQVQQFEDPAHLQPPQTRLQNMKPGQVILAAEAEDPTSASLTGNANTDHNEFVALS